MDLKSLDSAKCSPYDVPQQFLASESGFDRSFQFRVSKKSFEVIDIVVEADMLLKINLQVQNSKDNVNAFLYEDANMKSLKAFTESSSGQSKKLLTFIRGQRKAYKLKIVYDSLDESDECPLYHFRIAMKPL